MISDLSPQTIILAVGISAVLFVVFNSLSSPKSPYPNPPLASGTVILHTYRFVKDAHEFCLKLRDKYGPLVTINLGIGKYHILSDHKSAITEMYKNDKHFDIDFFLRYFNKQVEGMSEEFNTDEKITASFLKSTVKDLRNAPILDILAGRYKQSILEGFREIELPDFNPSLDTQPSIEVDLVPYMRKILFTASAEAIFGPKFPAKDMFETYTTMEYALPYLIRGYPRLACPKGYAARDMIIVYLERFFSNQDKDGNPNTDFCNFDYVSPVVKNHLKIFDTDAKKYKNPRDMATYMFGVLFSSTSNITNSGLWLTFYVFDNPEVYEEVTKILTEAYDEDTDDFDWKSLYGNAYIQSVLKETLRMHSNIVSARQVTHDSSLTVENDKTYFFKKGDIVIVPSDLVHSNEELYPDASTWKPKRFLDTTTTSANSKSTAGPKPEPNQPSTDFPKEWNTFLAWGGGNHMCGGRFFAKNEMIIQLVYTVWYLNLKFLEPIPPPYIKERFSLGTVHPAKGMMSTISRKAKLPT